LGRLTQGRELGDGNRTRGLFLQLSTSTAVPVMKCVVPWICWMHFLDRGEDNILVGILQPEIPKERGC